MHIKFARLVLTMAALFSVYHSCSTARAGLAFNVTYDTNTFGSYNVNDVENAFKYATQEYQNAFTNNVTVNLEVKFGSVSLGQSQTFLFDVGSYSDTVDSLKTEYGNAPSAARTSAEANFASSDPTNGGHFWVSTAEAKALDIGSNIGTDGVITFSNAATYTFDPNNRGESGAYDFIGVAEHEISEVMGRFALLGTTVGSPPNSTSNSFSADDLFRYTGKGSESVSSTYGNNTVYLSVDGGTTNLAYFNRSGNGGDLGDYNTVATDPYNASTNSGQAHMLSTADFTNLNVLGWDQAAVVPEPTSLALLGTGAFVVFAARRRRRKHAA